MQHFFYCPFVLLFTLINLLMLFSFFICIFVSYVIFYWKKFSIKNVQRIPCWHITLFSVLLFSIIAPIIQIALVMIDGDFLPPASRINLATLAVTEDLNVKFDFLFNRFPVVFLWERKPYGGYFYRCILGKEYCQTGKCLDNTNSFSWAYGFSFFISGSFLSASDCALLRTICTFNHFTGWRIFSGESYIQASYFFTW